MGVSPRLWAILLSALLFTTVLAQKVSKNPTDTITSGGHNSRSGYQDNHNLDPNVVASGSFNVIWKKKLLGNWNGFTEQIYAQPLVFTPADKQYVYVISQMNIAYIMDAQTGDIIISRQLKIPFLVTPDLQGCNDVADCIGSTATGVIDPDTGTWYVTTKTYSDQTKTTAQGLKEGRYFIHALDTLTLESRPNFPIPLEGIVGDNAPWRVFEGGKHHQRPALMQVGEFVYAGFASHCVQWNFTGWVIGWHATEGRLVTKYAMEGGPEKDGIGGGVWMSGGGLASDNPGRMFFATGNGYASQLADDPVPGRQPPTALEEAVVNMAINGDGSLTPTDFFMPWEKRDLDGMDKDLGTSGFVLLEPDVFSTNSVKRIGCVAGKTGKLYFLNLDDLGGYQMGPNRKDKALQVIEMAGPVFASAGTWPFDGGYVYVTPVGHQTVAFKFGRNGNGDPVFTQAGVTTEYAAGRQGVGHSSVTSMNGEPGSGILWIVDVDGSNLRAYGTIPVNGILPTLALFNNVGQTKFSRPTFGDGKVYLTTHTGYITAFGSPVNMPLNCSSPYDAGTVNIGNTSTTTISCKAKIPLTINTIDVDTPTNFIPFDFVVPKTLIAGESFSFQTNFTPKVVGPLSTNINLRTTNGGNEPYAINTPVVIRGTARSQTPILTIQPNVLSFGEFVVGSDSAGKSLQFTITNDGESPLIISSYKLSLNSTSGPFLPGTPNTAGPFSFPDLPVVGESVPGRTTVSTTVNFNPDTSGYFQVYLVITTTGGTKTVGAFGTAGSSPTAKLEWQLANGTWIPYQAGVAFPFGKVPLGTQQFRKLRLSNIGGTTLTTTISKPPVSGALAAVNALGSIAEGSQIAPGKFEEAEIICSPPKSQVNEDATTLRALWTMNNNDAAFGKTEIDFECNGASTQVGPLDADGQGWYRYLGCYKDANPARNLEELLYYSVNNTNGKCQTDCMALPRGFAFAATQYEGECWCGTKLPTVKVADTFCQYLCKGNFMEYCGGDGAYMSLFVDRRKYNIGGPSSSSSIPSATSSSTASDTASSTPSVTATGDPSITSSSTPTVSPSSVPTTRPNFAYLGCANEPTMGRALTKDSFANSAMTFERCQDYCTSKFYPLSGVEYATECYCGNTLENGSTIGSTQCVMACGGNPDAICGGPGALSVYNNTALVIASGPSVVPSVGEYISMGCYAEGVNERALAGAANAGAGMTVAVCVAFCKNGGFRYAGLEYATECYCAAVLAGTAAKAPEAECGMLCGGDKMAFCGSGGRLNVYAAAASNTTSSTSSTVVPDPTVIFSGSSVVSSSTTIVSPTGRPNFAYLGCANEGVGGRALTKDSFANSSMTLERCQDFCTSKSYPLSGVEYSTECFCGSTLENGSTIGGSTQCNMPCGGNPTAICGGPGALSVYNNTALVPPKGPAVVPSVGAYVSQGCYTEGTGERALAGAATAGAGMTVEMCVAFCSTGGWRYAGVEYSTECYCGAVLAATAAKAPEGLCGMLCGGDKLAYCGSGGRLNVYAAPAAVSSTANGTSATRTGTSATGTPVVEPNTTAVSSSTSTTSLAVFTPTLRPGFTYLGCANEGTNGRALSKDAYANSNMTSAMCQDFCSTKGYPLSGVEYSTECFCGNILENGSTIGGSTQCVMACGGSPNEICGGPGALSVYNNTAIVPPRQPAVVTEADGYVSLGCYTEGVNERALGASMTALAGMNVTFCVNFCQARGFKYAGLEYSTECYCGAAIATTATNVTAEQCNMLCGGDKYAYCGGSGKLNVYEAADASDVRMFATTISGSGPSSSFSMLPTVTGSGGNTTVTPGSTTTPVDSTTSPETTTSPVMVDSTAAETGTVGPTTISGSGPPSSFSMLPTVTESGSANNTLTLESTTTTASSFTTTSPTTTSTSAPASSTSASPWQYLGCANETSNRSLSGRATSGNMTSEKCQSFCFDNNFPLAGTEYGNQCYCGTALQNGATLNQTGCNMPCSGDPASICGGSSRLSVYNYTLYLPTIIVPSVGTYLSKGCYSEPASERALKSYRFTNTTMTVEMCITTCQTRNYGWAGVEYGKECHCGSVLSPLAAKVVDTQCNTPCGGNKRTYCGAGNRIIVYERGNSTAPSPVRRRGLLERIGSWVS